jgi:hypothetical protein
LKALRDLSLRPRCSRQSWVEVAIVSLASDLPSATHFPIPEFP